MADTSPTNSLQENFLTKTEDERIQNLLKMV